MLQKDEKPDPRTESLETQNEKRDVQMTPQTVNTTNDMIKKEDTKIEINESKEDTPTITKASCLSALAILQSCKYSVGSRLTFSYRFRLFQ